MGRGRLRPGGHAACGACHLEECVGAALGLGAGELGDVHVVVAVFGHRGLPVVLEFAVDVPGEDLQELRAADVVEFGVEVPAAVGILQHHRVPSDPVAFGLVVRPDRVSQGFPCQRSAFELHERDVHGVGHQVPHPSNQHVRLDARVGGDAGHQPGLSDTDLSAGQCVVPHPHTLTESGCLDPTMGLSTRQLQVEAHPALRGEESQVLEWLGGVEMVSHCDRCGLALAA